MERGESCVIVGTSGWTNGVEGTIAGITYGTDTHGVKHILGYMVQIGPFRGHYPAENVRSTIAYLTEHDSQIAEHLIQRTMIDYALDTGDRALFEAYAGGARIEQTTT